jgi:hypothetical protein
LDAATTSLQRWDEQSGGEMGRGEEEWLMERAALRQGGVGRGSGQWGSTGPGAALPGRRCAHREQGSEVERGVQYEGEKRGSGEADGWDHPGSGPRLSVKEREREEYDRWGPGQSNRIFMHI